MPAAELSQRYRGGQGRGASYFASSSDFTAYAATRLPATFAALRTALAQAALSLPGFAPTSLLDAGAGPGTAAWAASAVWPSLARSTLLEREAGMHTLGKALAANSSRACLSGAQWVRTDLTADWQAAPADIVTAAYVLNELKPEQRGALVRRLWDCTAGLLVLVEPGTPEGTERILQAREELLSLGAHIAAPCPHAGPCPLQGGDWCHFSVRVARSRLHRQAKGADRAYEDEKFAYVAVSRTQAAPCAARVLRHPLTRKGHVVLELCTPDGVRNMTATRSRKEHYRLAKDLNWGAPVPPELLGGREEP